jgi:hypothetical protein
MALHVQLVGSCEASTFRPNHCYAKGVPVNVVIWRPSMFLLGIVGMGLCIAFLEACEKI